MYLHLYIFFYHSINYLNCVNVPKKQKFIKYLSTSIQIIMGNTNDNGSFLQKG
jgi:hypothetical protein